MDRPEESQVGFNNAWMTSGISGQQGKSVQDKKIFGKKKNEKTNWQEDQKQTTKSLQCTTERGSEAHQDISPRGQALRTPLK